MVVLFGRHSYIITGRSNPRTQRGILHERYWSFDCFGTRNYRGWDSVFLCLASEERGQNDACNALHHRGYAFILLDFVWLDVV